MTLSLSVAAPSLSIAALASVAEALAGAHELWWPKVRRDAEARWHVSLLEGDDFEAFLQGWPPGEGVELHDHGSASGAMVVVGGTLVETYIEGSDWARPGGRLHHRRLPEGTSTSFGPDYIHDVVNGGLHQALSIHVYSPRLRSMTFYENRPDRGLAAVRTEFTRPDLLLV